MTSENHDQTSDQQALEALERQEGNLTSEQSKSFEQEANADLASRGLKVVQEVHYQAKLQCLIDLTYEPIPSISDALLALLAPTAPGFSAGELRDGVKFFLDKAAHEAKKDLASKQDIDLPNFDFSKLKDNRECYGSIKPEISGWLLNHKYTLHELDCAPGYSREPLSATGYLAHAPLFYVGRNGLLCNNWDVSTVVYSDKAVKCMHDFMPNEYCWNQKNAYGMGQIFTGKFDREKLSQASIEIQILYYLWYIAANMVRSGAIMPQLIVNYEQRLQCRWIPAILSDKIKILVTKVGLFLQGYEHLFLHRTDRTGPMDPLFLGQLMLSGFIHSYVSWAFLWYGKPLQLEQLEYRVLFANYACPINSSNIQESALQMRLESWLSPLAMGQLSFTPVLRFYDLDDPEIRNGSLFMVLSHEIYDSSQNSKLNQQKAISNLDPALEKSIDLAQDKIEHNWDLDELAEADADVKADSKDVLIAKNTVHNLSMEDALKYSFDNTLGVGLELGFMGFDASITSNLYNRGLIDDSGIVSMSLLLSEPCCESVRYECLRTTSRLSSIASVLNELISAPQNICIVPLNNLYDVLQIAVNALTLLGVKLILPRSLTSLMRPTSRVRLDIDEESSEDSRYDSSHQSMMTLASALTFDWQLAIGNQRLSASEFKVLLANTGKIVRFHNQFVYADPEALLKIQKHLKNQQMLQANRAALLNAVFTGKLDDNEVSLSPALQQMIKQITTPVDVPEPEGLNAQLRPYQKRGYEWLMHNLKVNIGSILADDMGLGKTLQVITTLLKLKEEGQIDSDNQVLVIVPTSLITNWSREIKHFAPALTVSAFHTMHCNNLDSLKTDIVLTSYGVARSRIKDLTKHHYRLLIVDEAQAIKNRDTAVNKALRELHADYFIAMSGTPVENHLIEYYSILDFANRGLFGTVDSFRRSFATPIEKDRDMAAVERFRSLTAPFILRRLKSDKSIISDLPEKVSSDQYCMLTPNQTALYESVVQETMRRLDEMEDRQDRSAIVLNLVQNLRAICNSPAQYEKSESHFKSTDSGKVERLIELVDEITDAGGKALIFTQSVVMGNYLVEILREHTGHAPQFLNGKIGIRERMDMVDRFQTDPNERFMLLSLRAAGTGLNLTAANYVIHFDLWWNPAVENQATDRAYRIGQKKNVQVFRFICANTFEERINEMINSKRDLAELTVAQGETWIGDLSNRQLNELFALSK